jgi:hypothetical protein
MISFPKSGAGPNVARGPDFRVLSRADGADFGDVPPWPSKRPRVSTKSLLRGLSLSGTQVPPSGRPVQAFYALLISLKCLFLPAKSQITITAESRSGSRSSVRSSVLDQLNIQLLAQIDYIVPFNWPIGNVRRSGVD